MIGRSILDNDAALARTAEAIGDLSDGREETPAHTETHYWSRLKAVLKRFSITRVSDITGLDRIGVPVVQATRPLALSNAVSQGKGTSLAQAAIGATLEAIETAAAERIDRKKLTEGTPSAMLGRSADTQLGHHIHADIPAGAWIDRQLTWVQGINLATGTRQWVPSALVHTDFLPTSPHSDSPFVRSTTGLGAGPSLSRAVLHGMQEVVERAATGRAEEMHGFFERKRFDPVPFANKETIETLGRLLDLNILSGFYLCPSDDVTCTVWAHLLDGQDGPLGIPLPANGFACRRTLEEAIAAALLEAIQTRASVIAAARDDITRTSYPKYPDLVWLEFERDRLRQQAPAPDRQSSGRRRDMDAGESWFGDLKQAIGTNGHDPVCIPLLFDPDVPLFVVRILDIGATEREGQGA